MLPITTKGTESLRAEDVATGFDILLWEHRLWARQWTLSGRWQVKQHRRTS